MNEQDLIISELGHRGDGIAQTEHGPVYVAGALPGEKLRARVLNGRAVDPTIVTASPDRIAPICGHSPTSGSCSMQHLAQEPYLKWKQDLVGRALKGAGIEAAVSETLSATAGGRRRAVLTAGRAGRKPILGYHERASQKLVDAAGCKARSPAIERALPDLLDIAVEVLPKKGDMRVTVLETTAGLDVAIEKADRRYDKKIPDLSRKCIEMDLARLSVNGEVLLEVRPPMLVMEGVGVVPPPGAFSQATLAGEEALCRLVLDGVGRAKTVADLFSGIGTFALRLAKRANVHAVESDANAIAAFDKAIRNAHGLKKVSFERRDLFRRPLVLEELEPFDAVVFDPPRAGAQAQAELLAQSGVKTIVAVSCNPATFARDVRLLLDGGYTLQSVTPVDQFHYSPHIEVVGVLIRE